MALPVRFCHARATCTCLHASAGSRSKPAMAAGHRDGSKGWSRDGSEDLTSNRLAPTCTGSVCTLRSSAGRSFISARVASCRAAACRERLRGGQHWPRGIAHPFLVPYARKAPCRAGMCCAGHTKKSWSSGSPALQVIALSVHAGTAPPQHPTLADHLLPALRTCACWRSRPAAPPLPASGATPPGNCPPVALRSESRSRWSRLVTPASPKCASALPCCAQPSSSGQSDSTATLQGAEQRGHRCR